MLMLITACKVLTSILSSVPQNVSNIRKVSKAEMTIGTVSEK